MKASGSSAAAGFGNAGAAGATGAAGACCTGAGTGDWARGASASAAAAAAVLLVSNALLSLVLFQHWHVRPLAELGVALEELVNFCHVLEWTEEHSVSCSDMMKDE
jgi:hypothetical protein